VLPRASAALSSTRRLLTSSGLSRSSRLARANRSTPRAPYLKARPSVRRRFNDAVLGAVHVKDRRSARAEFSEVFAPLFSRPSSNMSLKVEMGVSGFRT
jgi:hypothetical protein